MAKTSYALGLGANRYRSGGPAAAIGAALGRLEREGVEITARSRTVGSRPLGPGVRDFANAVAIVETGLAPEALLALAKRIEHDFGRRPGRRWGDRPLDIDILLWSEGMWASEGLSIPHPALRERRFVLDPLAEIAPGWRDPVTGLAVRHLRHRLASAVPVDRRGAAS